MVSRGIPWLPTWHINPFKKGNRRNKSATDRRCATTPSSVVAVAVGGRGSKGTPNLDRTVAVLSAAMVPAPTKGLTRRPMSERSPSSHAPAACTREAARSEVLVEGPGAGRERRG